MNIKLCDKPGFAYVCGEDPQICYPLSLKSGVYTLEYSVQSCNSPIPAQYFEVISTWLLWLNLISLLIAFIRILSNIREEENTITGETIVYYTNCKWKITEKIIFTMCIIVALISVVYIAIVFIYYGCATRFMVENNIGDKSINMVNSCT